jgi:tRNA A-37 threonylcarbamoyl transferase component Bud32
MSNRQIGNYRTTEYIGGGGFGSVFKAEDTSSPGRVVAIKELHKKHTRNPVIKQRFFQEAVAMARLDHPNLPRLFTFGEDSGCYYLVMEFISGKTLRDEMHDRGPLRPEIAAAIIGQALEALSYAHRNGIIHRDLKPDNILLVEGGSLKIKVLDFGIARMVGGENLTLAGEGFGTPAYMSPERIMGASGDDPRIDIYSAGIILFEMLAGAPPYESRASDPAVYWAEMREFHEKAPLPSLGESPELERIIARATAKRIEDRYRSADEMLADIRNAYGESLASIPRSSARLQLTTLPGDAQVYIDDALRGSSDPVKGKLLIEGLAAGLRSVRVAKAGYSEYRINVALEENHQTELQVALAAHATMAMPSVEATAAAELGTAKLENKGAENNGPENDGVENDENAQTAVLMVESLPAGSAVYLGTALVAKADEDGRATIELSPGAHEVKVAAPSGSTATKTVMVTTADAGSQKKITIPIEDAAKTEYMPVAAVASEPPAAKKRIAVIASIALLIALMAGAYFAFRSPARENIQSDSATTQQAKITGADSSTADSSAASSAASPVVAEPAASPASAEGDAKKIAEDIQKAQSNAERAMLEKKLAEAEKKINEEKKAAANKTPDPAAAPPAQAPPAPPVTAPPIDTAPPRQAEDQAEGNACVVVSVAAPEGTPLGRFKVSVVEQSDKGTPAFFNGHLGQRGRWRGCGFTAGRRIKVDLFGPRGVLIATKQSIVSASGAFVEFSAADKLSDAAPPIERERKPIRRMRP